MAKEFAFQQFPGNGAAVDGNEGFLFAGAVEVHGPGNQFLSCPGFAKDENGRIGLGDLLHLFEDRLHRRTAADHVGKAVFAAQLLAQVLILGNEAALFQGIVEEDFQFFDVDRFGEVIEGSFFHRLDRCFGRGISGHEDDMGLRRQLFDMTENIETADPRQQEVGNDDRKGRLCEVLQGTFAAVAGRDLVSLLAQQQGEAITVAAIVIDDENLCCRFTGVDGRDHLLLISKDEKNRLLLRNPIGRTTRDIKYFLIS